MINAGNPRRDAAPSILDATTNLPSPQPPVQHMWQRSSSPPPRKLGDTVFRYRDIEPQNREVRLLRISPGLSSMIHCELAHTSLETADTYKAISYAWGDPYDTTVVTLEGREFPVTTSLYQALQKLRSTDEAVLVWADAICINQSNLEERGHQVQLMAEIYRAASEVVVWLGPEADDSSAAIDLLRDLLNQSELEDIYRSRVRWLINDGQRHRSWYALVCLFEREYWKRLWVIQEILNAKAVTVLCGSSALPWRAYVEAIDALTDHMPDLQGAFSAYLSPEGTRFNNSLTLKDLQA
jgi:hypothetical protein